MRNLAIVETIRRADEPAGHKRLERQQVAAELGRMFGRAENLLQAMQDHADALEEELRRTPLPQVAARSRRSEERISVSLGTD